MRLWSRSKSTRADGIHTRTIGALAFLCLAASPAAAHGFGARYELPLPLSFYLFGAAAAIVVSFIVAGLFVRPRAHHRYPRVDLLAGPVGRLLAHPALVWSLKLVVLGLFILILAAGFIGAENPYRNIAPTLVWIVGWVGLAYLSAVFGDLWALVNPWRALFVLAEGLHQRLTRRASLSFDRPYPATLGVWPAFFLLLAFSWIELVHPSPAVPLHIAWFVAAYSAVTFIGMALFGRETWLRHGEVFTVVFSTFARFAPVDLHGRPHRRLALRPPGSGLLDSRSVSNSTVAFVLLLLATVLYDGASTSPEWLRLEGALAALIAPGDFAAIAIKSAGLVTFWLLFAGAYVGVSALMSIAVAGRIAPLAMARSFAFTLVPIAIGYHVAHYLTFLLVQGQYIIPLASDPFGFGWDLLGTAGYRVDIAIVGARFTWTTAVGAVVAGHLAAVYLAHRQAMQVLASRGDALASQVPLTALMVLYTLVSLTILAEPVVERRVAAEPSTEIAIPAQAVRPDPNGLLQPVGAGQTARAKLTYRILGSAFHDGTRTTAADLLYATLFAYRWSAGLSPDPVVAAASAPLRRLLIALQVVGTDTASKSFRVGDVNFVRELFTVDVYVNAAPNEPDQGTAAPWSTVPWHVLVLMEEAVSRGWAAFSASEAARRGVPWLDLVRSDDIKTKLANLAVTFERDGYRPEALAAQVSAEDARRRWAALAAFHRTYGHFLVTNGPYRLKSWATDSVTLEAFRDLTYPLGVGSYDAYAVPRRGFVTKVDWNAERATLSGDVEVMQKFQRSYRLVRTALLSLAPEVAKRLGAEARYTIVDDAARVVRAGTAKLADDATFRIDLSALPAGRYTLLAAIALAGNAMNAEISRTVVTVAKP